MSGSSGAYAEANLSDHQGRVVWRAMYRDVCDRRLTSPFLAGAVTRITVLVCLLAVALWLGWFGRTALEFAVAWIVLALVIAQFAFVAHDAGHGTLARSGMANRALGQLAMTVVAGLAFDEWIARHRAHHQYCQDEARDPDMAIDWVASLTVESGSRKRALGRFMTRHQAWMIWPLTLLFGHSQRHASQAAALLNPARFPLDAAAVALHYLLWFGLPCVLLEVPLEAAIVAYAVPATLLGPYLAAIFWVNHVGMPLVRDVRHFSFLEHQAVTSRTINCPPACDWLFGGLNYQIEHHLFPQVPSGRLSAVQPIVRDHFARHGLAYNGVTWREAVRAVAVHLGEVARAS